jgi:hypothetical protein
MFRVGDRVRVRVGVRVRVRVRMDLPSSLGQRLFTINRLGLGLGL